MWEWWVPKEVGEGDHRWEGHPWFWRRDCENLREEENQRGKENEEERRVDVVEGSVGLPWTVFLAWVGGS
jgi:hypothetical protein